MSITKMLRTKADLNGIAYCVVTRHPYIIISGKDKYVRVFNYNTYSSVTRFLKDYNTPMKEQVMMVHWVWYKIVGSKLEEVTQDE